MKFKNLLFDGDDTLFDFSQAADFAFRTFCSAQYIPDTPENRRIYGDINRELWNAFDRGEITKEFVTRERFVRFLDRIGLKRDPDGCNRDYLAALGQGVYPMPNAPEVCRSLTGEYRLYLITNAVASVQRSRLRGSVFAPFFSGAFISEEAGAAKPSAAYFSYVLSHIPGATRENCLVIGDSLATDIRGANNAGLKCCWFNPHGMACPPDLRIDYVIRDLTELLGLL